MNTTEWYEYSKAYKDEADALADCNMILAEALRILPNYAAQREFLEKVIEVIESEPGTGVFSRAVEIENGRMVTYRFSFAVGTGSGFRVAGYKERFRADLPAWVQRRHPYLISCLCRLALEDGKPLPEIAEERFAPQEAQFLRDLREEADRSLSSAVRAAHNREWLAALGTQLTIMKPRRKFDSRESQQVERRS